MHTFEANDEIKQWFYNPIAVKRLCTFVIYIYGKHVIFTCEQHIVCTTTKYAELKQKSRDL